MSIIQTSDGTQTVQSTKYGVSYHSIHGALQETMHVFIDAGYGADLVDRLRELTRNPIRAVPFGGKAIKEDHYINKRAEMYGECNKWLTNPDEPVSLLDSDELHADLCATLFTTDSNSRLQILSKDQIIKKLGFSPDLSDSFVLTFAEPVIHFNHGRRVSKPVIRGNV